MFVTLLLAAGVLADSSAPPLRVVTSLTTYGAIAREIVGDKGMVTSIAQGDEDPHFVQPKPSFVRILRDADLFVTTGMDLELWVPALLDRAGNRKIADGAPGYVAAYRGIDLLEVPTSVSRSQGDIHVDGNPHIHTDPLNGIIIARNILAGLQRVSPWSTGSSSHGTSSPVSSGCRPAMVRSSPAGRRTSSSGCSRPPWARPWCRR
jgi:zinc/manganese transport system substrate-binding protein